MFMSVNKCCRNQFSVNNYLVNKWRVCITVCVSLTIVFFQCIHNRIDFFIFREKGWTSRSIRTSWPCRSSRATRTSRTTRNPRHSWYTRIKCYGPSWTPWAPRASRTPWKSRAFWYVNTLLGCFSRFVFCLFSTFFCHFLPPGSGDRTSPRETQVSNYVAF